MLSLHRKFVGSCLLLRLTALAQPPTPRLFCSRQRPKIRAPLRRITFVLQGDGTTTGNGSEWQFIISADFTVAVPTAITSIGAMFCRYIPDPSGSIFGAIVSVDQYWIAHPAMDLATIAWQWSSRPEWRHDGRAESDAAAWYVWRAVQVRLFGATGAPISWRATTPWAPSMFLNGFHHSHRIRSTPACDCS